MASTRPVRAHPNTTAARRWPLVPTVVMFLCMLSSTVSAEGKRSWEARVEQGEDMCLKDHPWTAERILTKAAKDANRFPPDDPRRAHCRVSLGFVKMYLAIAFG